MAYKSDIELSGSSLHIVKQCGHALSEILNSKFGCLATIEGLDFESTGNQKRQTVAPEKRFSVRLPAGVEVSVWKADLTTFKVDAVVNAANCGLQHGAGLAYALCEAGGPQIQRESDIYISSHGPLATGEAVVTSAGSLPCRKIIHAVGPQLSHNPSFSEFSQAESLLEKAIKSILHKVKENHLDTVAIPAISSGLFNYPLRECANTITSTVKKYCEYFYQGHLPKEVLFVNHDEPTVTEMEMACRQILGPNQYNQPMSNSQAAGSNTRHAAETSKVTVQIGSVFLTLKKDNIEEQMTDVIVNTTSQNLDLAVGKISSALLKKAGPGMQNEIQTAHQTKHLIITGSYKLHCKEVYHTFCMKKDNKGASKFLYDSVSECLWTAASNKHKSIAFPAIGTGALGFSKEESAQIMSDAVANFAKNFLEKMEVYFVIFPADSGTFQGFKERMKYFQQSTSRSNFTQANDNKEDKAPSPQITLNGPSEESIREAKKWLIYLLTPPSSIVIYNNFIQHLSEKEYQQLSRLTKNGVVFEEFLANGHACLKLDGVSVVDVVAAALQVEAMLCTVQMQFVEQEENDVFLLLGGKAPRERETKTIDERSPDFRDRYSAFSHEGLRILKVDRVENPSLELLFDLKKEQLRCTSETMFQRIPAQFCKMISQIGFHAECAPPEAPKYGEGIYFARSVKKAMEVWLGQKEEYLYFVEAEVLTGKSTLGEAGLILPPVMKNDPSARFDSVRGGSDIAVIFSSYQALPKYIITCEKKPHSQVV